MSRLLIAVALSVCLALVSCARDVSQSSVPVRDEGTAAPSAFASTTAPLQATLNSLAVALHEQDRPAYEALVANDDPTFAATGAMIFDNVRALSLVSLTFRAQGAPANPRLAGQEVLGAPALVQPVVVRWQLEADPQPAEHTVWMTFRSHAGAWKLVATTDGPTDAAANRPEPQWWLERVTVSTRGPVTVVGSENSAQLWADRGWVALAAVRQRLPGTLTERWSGRAVIEMPATRQSFERVLGATPGTYARIAAVAWPEGPDAARAPIRIIVNPALAPQLSELAAAVLLTHELAHLATHSADSPAPLWLVEGLADYVAYDAYPSARAAAAAAVLTRIRRDGPPRELPGNEQFTPSAGDLDLTYAESWLAARFVADTYSPARLQALYQTMDRGDAFGAATASVLEVSEPEFVAAWQRYLMGLARKG